MHHIEHSYIHTSYRGHDDIVEHLRLYRATLAAVPCLKAQLKQFETRPEAIIILARFVRFLKYCLMILITVAKLD